MFSYLNIAIIVVILIFFVEHYILRRQHRLYKVSTVPKRFSRYVTPEQFAKSQAYNFDKSTLSLFRLTFDCIVNLVVCLNIRTFFDFVSDIAHSLFRADSPLHTHHLAASISFTVIGIFLFEVLELPFELYSTFVVEQRHGFNKTTLGTFVCDMVKTLVMKVLIIPVVSAVFILLVMKTGPSFPMFIWAFILLVKLILYIAYPICIQPLFNRFESLEEGPLKVAIEKLAGRVNFPLTKLFKVDGSTRSSHSNAYQYGFCKNKRIVLYDTLIEQCSQEQVVAILGHELGHWSLSHMPVTFLLLEVVSFLTFYAMRFFLFSRKMYTDFGFDDTPVFVGAILFFFMYSPFNSVTMLFLNTFLRKFEFQADDFSKKLGHAKALSEGLQVIGKENLSGLLVDPIYSMYHHSHPPIPERIMRLEKQD